MYKLEEKKNKNKNNSPHKNALVLYINTWYRRTASVCACWNYKKYPLHLRTDDVTAGMVRAHFFFRLLYSADSEFISQMIKLSPHWKLSYIGLYVLNA